MTLSADPSAITQSGGLVLGEEGRGNDFANIGQGQEIGSINK